MLAKLGGLDNLVAGHEEEDDHPYLDAFHDPVAGGVPGVDGLEGLGIAGDDEEWCPGEATFLLNAV